MSIARYGIARTYAHKCTKCVRVYTNVYKKTMDTHISIKMPTTGATIMTAAAATYILTTTLYLIILSLSSIIALQDIDIAVQRWA